MPDPDGNRGVAQASLAPRLTALAAQAEAAGYMDIADWARSECNGYRADVPAYRRVTGLPMGFNPIKGWIPLYAENANLLVEIGSRGMRQSVPVIEQAIERSANGKALIHHSSEVIAIVNKAVGMNYAQIAVNVDVRNLQSILLSVASLAERWEAQLGPPVALPEGGALRQSA